MAARQRWSSWFISQIGVIKDTVIALGGIVYLAGYLVWSYYAWRYHLGPVPALQGQYFVAGLLAVGLLAATTGTAYAVSHAANVWWPRYVREKNNTLRRVLLVGMAALLIVSVVVVMLANAGVITGSEWPQTVATFVAIGVLPFVFSGLQLAPRITGNLIRVFVVAYVFVIAALFLLRLVEQWYPTWPQELGGGKPRSAYLTLYKSDAGGLSSLWGPYKIPAGSDVVTTFPVFVLVRTPDSLIVARTRPNRRFNGEPIRYEIPMKAIASIDWVEGL